jgi:hypothetical protein
MMPDEDELILEGRAVELALKLANHMGVSVEKVVELALERYDNKPKLSRIRRKSGAQK